MTAWELLTKANDRAYLQAESVSILIGHMTNAIIDLQSGETKATAIATLERGLAIIEERQAPMRALADAIAMARDSAETACPAPVPQDCQARAGTASPKEDQ